MNSGKLATRRAGMLWRAWSTLCGIGVLSGGLGYAIVACVSGSDAVMVYTDVRDKPTKPIPYRGMLTYTADIERLESCPGEVVTVYRNLNQESAPAFITIRKPSYLNDVKAYTGIKISNELPASVFPGKWCVGYSLVSRCANRERTDLLTSLEFEVAAQ